ncbi:MAG: GDP-mannose 4,6-dehydratase [Planctomycetota bacterium]|jgi:GDPmannose 4,6-dehydratase
MSKVALITGITGQDGSYLAEFLLYKGYEVHGIIRRSSSFNTARIEPIDRFKLHFGDLQDGNSIAKLLAEIQPDEIYNLGAQSHVRVSFDVPSYTVDATGMGVLRFLEGIRTAGLAGKTRFYQAGSSEMYGGLYDGNTILNEGCRFHPRSPYGCAKVFAHNIAVNFRESYDMFVSNGILFNHESPRRGETFVTRKITRYLANLLKTNVHAPLFLGNLEAKRDWGYSPEYVVAMWKILQHNEPDDFVIATGETHSVEEFLNEAFEYLVLDWKSYVKFDERYLRPAEVHTLIGDATKAKVVLDWEPKITFKQLVRLMVDADMGKEDPNTLKSIWESA